eukprot:355251-Chlamydomonas_euryale.AAC.1
METDGNRWKQMETDGNRWKPGNEGPIPLGDDPGIGWCGTPDWGDAIPLGGGLTRCGPSTPPNPRPTIRAEKRSQSSIRDDEGVPP